MPLVDHGTPLRSVNQIREEIGQQVKVLLSGQVTAFSTCSMERRDGPEYDFNDPLLESVLSDWSVRYTEDIVLAQLFLSPGRHAGKGGGSGRNLFPVFQICCPYRAFRPTPIYIGHSGPKIKGLGKREALIFY